MTAGASPPGCGPTWCCSTRAAGAVVATLVAGRVAHLTAAGWDRLR